MTHNTVWITLLLVACLWIVGLWDLKRRFERRRSFHRLVETLRQPFRPQR